MTIIHPLQTAGTVRAARARKPQAGFSVSNPAASKNPAGEVAGPGMVGLDGLLALQEGAVETTRDRAARRHGQSLLRLLGDLQRELLADDGGGVVLRRLAELAATAPPCDDPALAGVLRACAVRASVELARRGL